MSEVPKAETASSAEAAPASDRETFAHIGNYISTRGAASPIYAMLFSPPALRLTHASKGLVVARLSIGAAHLNSSGSLHGSVSATVVDWAGGLAIAAWDRRDATGVSVDLHVSFLSGARLGDEVEIEGRVDRVGGNLAFTQVGIFKVDGEGNRGAAVALGRHTKFVGGRK